MNIDTEIERASKRTLIATLIREQGVTAIANVASILQLHRPEQFAEVLRSLAKHQPGWFHPRKKRR